MRKKIFVKNEEGDVLGLPMYLIVVMIVAVAVIAAVIYMIPKGTRTMTAQVVSGATQTGTIQTDGSVSFGSFSVKVTVTTNDDRRDPVVGATVRFSGGGVVAEGKTNAQGEATITVNGANLNVGVNEAYMKMTVKASGFEDFDDDSAVLLYRPS
ncbi:MAG: hypothetical protein QHH19_00475 [Candidatus Thermoplasmatota archaeon]|jgi:uncharacterized protein YcfJ|nr:hypothetical protein [Candidatus Thermoplasmatota archaeon]